MTREEAIKILRREIECLSHTKCEDCILEVACDPIKTTPFDSEYIEVYEMAISALSENKGEWIAYDHGMGLVYLRCPFCGATIDKRHVEHNFCGKCGAKLSGEKSGFER